jgi:hypothetical protein
MTKRTLSEGHTDLSSQVGNRIVRKNRFFERSAVVFRNGVKVGRGSFTFPSATG